MTEIHFKNYPVGDESTLVANYLKDHGVSSHWNGVAGKLEIQGRFKEEFKKALEARFWEYISYIKEK